MESAADRVINHLGPLLALQPRRRFRKDTVLIVDGTLVPTRDHTVGKQEHNRLHRKVRARVEHAFARMENWKILRDCRLKGTGVHHAVRGIARLHNLTLAG